MIMKRLYQTLAILAYLSTASCDSKRKIETNNHPNTSRPQYSTREETQKPLDSSTRLDNEQKANNTYNLQEKEDYYFGGKGSEDDYFAGEQIQIPWEIIIAGEHYYPPELEDMLYEAEKSLNERRKE